MDAELERSTREYYDERTEEYDEIYTLGTGPASISDPDAYKTETADLSKLVGRFARGRLIDVGCGTAFWLPHYAPKCSAIALVDQSSRMLSVCRDKVRHLGIEHKCVLVRDDFFAHPFGRNAFDTAIVAFFLSHVPADLDGRFFAALRRILTPEGRFLILDSIWSRERARTRQKEGRQQRALNDGRTFEIYKRYFGVGDFRRMGAEHRLNLSIVHAGRVFIAAAGAIP